MGSAILSGKFDKIAEPGLAVQPALQIDDSVLRIVYSSLSAPNHQLVALVGEGHRRQPIGRNRHLVLDYASGCTDPDAIIAVRQLAAGFAGLA